MAVSTGGKAAEAFGDAGFQLGLVVLNHKQVIAFFVFDGLTDFALAKHRVARDNRSLKRQFLQDCKRGGNFVLAGLHHDIADDRRQPGRESGEHMQRFGVEPTRSFQRLAVNRDMPRRSIPRAKPPRALAKASPSSD
jgi:hypothetical protein